MAGYNPSDIQFAIIKEAVAGTFPASGALLKIDHVPGNSPSYTSDMIDSPVVSTARASGGSRKTNYRVEGSLKTHLSRDAATELLLQSALSGLWVEAGGVGDAGDVLKAGDTDTSFSIEKKVNGTPALYSRYSGNQVSKFSLTVDASGNAEASFDVLGMGRVTSTTASALTYSNASANLKLAGPDVNNITVGGLSGLQFRTLELSVEQNREARDAFGSTSAIGIGTSGNRKVTLSATFYRTDFSPESVLAGDGTVPVSFTIGLGAESFTFTIPAANASIPQDEEDGSKYMVKVEFTAKRDNTAGTDFMITRG